MGQYLGLLSLFTFLMLLLYAATHTATAYFAEPFSEQACDVFESLCQILCVTARIRT